jgi:transcription elongation factor Elf1
MARFIQSRVAGSTDTRKIRFMDDAITIQCPHCGESFSLAVDLSEGSAEFVVDCEVCCRPMAVSLQVEDGELSGFEVTPD